MMLSSYTHTDYLLPIVVSPTSLTQSLVSFMGYSKSGSTARSDFHPLVLVGTNSIEPYFPQPDRESTSWDRDYDATHSQSGSYRYSNVEGA